MPLYPFVCRGCGRSFDALVARPSADATAPCPDCGGTEVDRGLGLPAAVAVAADKPATNCRGDGPPCGAAWCGRAGTN